MNKVWLSVGAVPPRPTARLEARVDLTWAVDLEAINSPLRHYTVIPNNGNYVFTHRRTGKTLLARYRDVHAEWLGSKADHDDSPIGAFERVLPLLCYACGIPLTTPELGLCSPCEQASITRLSKLAS